MIRKALVVTALLLSQGCVHRPAPPPLTANVVGKAADFSLPEYPGGKPHSLVSDKGSVLLLDVWASWCDPCRDALPMYEQLLKEYGPRGFKVYAINVDEDPRQIAPFVEETKLNLPVLVDTKAVIAEGQLGVRVMPSSFIVDKKGVIRFFHEGFSEEYLSRYQAQIEQLLAEPEK